jgi:hypothetical protein
LYKINVILYKHQYSTTPKYGGNFPMKTIKCKYYLLCIVTVSIFCLQQLQTLANSVTVGDYTLTVSKGSPAYSPEAPTIMRTDYKNYSTTDRRINVNFSLKIEKRTARGLEDISADIKTCTYEMDLSSGVTFYGSTPSSLGKNGAAGSYTKTNQKFHSSVIHILEAWTVGNKALIMRVTVTMKDGTVLTAFASNSFKVCDYVITIYSYVGDINNRLVSNGYIYDLSMMPSDATFNKSIGHATWQTEERGSMELALTAKWNKYVDIPCGFSVTSMGSYTILNKLLTYPASGLPVNASGYLKISDQTGGANKQFKMTKIQAKNALDKTLNIDNTKPDYNLHSNNCVDNAISVAGAGGVILSDCKLSVTITYGINANADKIALPSELEIELKK